MPARSKARKRAVDLLYECDIRGLDVLAVLPERVARADPPWPAYAVEVVQGVAAHRARVDEILGAYAVGWTLDRMPPVDRAVLRLAMYELLFRADIPTAVVIDEAVQLAKKLSTEQSPAFVNGLLGRVAADAASRALPEAPAGS